MRVVACILLVLSADSGNAADSLIRRFPYPFSHMISFASDVDVQAPWHGAAIHRVLNEEIGLPISDSLWAQGASIDASSLLLGGIDLNNRLSGIGTDSIFGLLIRQWHRGNIDTLHSWQDDAIPPLVQRIDRPVKIVSVSTTVAVEPGPKSLTSFYYRHLRLYFDATPPEDMFWKLYDDVGNSVIISVAQIKAGKAVKSDSTKPPFIVEAIMGVPQDIGLPVTREIFDLFRLTKIEVVATSCSNGCAAAITRVDRDSFSRRSVSLQLPWLEVFDIRPAMLSSHGGWSLAQNFGPADFTLMVKREPGGIYEDELVPNVLRLLGNDPHEYAYHSDLLRRFGVNTLWSYSNNSNHLWNRQVPRLASSITGFYDLIRTTTGIFRTSSLEDFLEDVRAMESRLKNVDLNDIYCAHTCWGDQGAVFGLLVALGFTQMDIRSHVDQLWYTHFASGDDEFKRSIETPLRPSAVAWMRRLANYYYNFDGNIKLSKRVWVSPTGVVARYRIAYAQIAPHVSVNPQTSEVRIDSWKDRITGRILPDPLAGTRDFHGITIYVPDAGKAILTIAGRETNSFTRNLPDDSGRPSITIVDDSTPEVLLDEIPLAANGTVETSGGKWRDPGEPRQSAASGQSFGTLTATGGDAVVRWKPSHLDLWNVTHLSLAYRKSVANNLPQGKFMLEIEMADGGMIAVSDDSRPRNASDRSQWFVRRSDGVDGWTRAVLAVSDLRWPKGGLKPEQQRPALPIGRVREIRFGLIGASPGERLDIDTVAALRPNSNNVDPAGGKLVGGQVISADGKPAPSIVVRADVSPDKTITTVTDKNGYYYFFHQPVGRVMKIAASKNGRLCQPLRGSLLQVRKDEAEIDIRLDRCRQ